VKTGKRRTVVTSLESFSKQTFTNAEFLWESLGKVHTEDPEKGVIITLRCLVTDIGGG
jgi:hypothetical protein